MDNSQQILQQETTYLGQDTIGGILCDIGYIKKFKWSWFATQLNTFIIIGSTGNPIDKRAIESFSENCFKYSLKNNKGWPRGLQSGVVSISILKGKSINNDAVEFCKDLSKKHWSAMEIPVLYNVDQQKGIRFKNTPIWGFIYFPYLSGTIDSILNKLSA
jgi:hypothetical protein